ncbi:replication-associated recombination protein A [Streptomyces hoynatensis]|uniref:Replication-associated recombination protein A n=1 Tax=Streptomyces hoynatensis TaxID=1141874 RepID=A0A3A9Z8K5_9ACTN|nr:replication-associated recombination protein A [Streptomyces hoynatensis]RKN44695.1 replication-associated recombination protein A [Streptomyces hoynatensis]
MEPDLFTAAAEERAERDPAARPLAVRMRPTSLDEVVGQRHLLRPGSPLRRLVGERGGGPAGPSSVLLWGPPGTGKTTLAYVVSQATDRRFVELSAITAGVKEVRAVIDGARRSLGAYGKETVLFLDEIHRFSKAQQDSLLPAVENRWVTLIAATTENPYFSVISPLLSRSLLLTLEPLTEEDVRALLRRAVAEERGLGGAVALPADSEAHLLRIAGGDARRALTALEAGAGAALAKGESELTLATLEEAVDRAAVTYDRDGDQHYDVASALIKSVRGSDVDAALHYLARMIEAGEDPRFIARRLMISASEDIGLADPAALQTAVAAAQAVAMIGFPEAALTLAHATIALALAPKSNAVVTAIGQAQADVRAGLAGPVPPHLRDSHYRGAAKLGHGEGYQYPHDLPGGIAAQQYAPDAVHGKRYYRPTRHGAEARYAEVLQRVRARLAGEKPGEQGGPD